MDHFVIDLSQVPDEDLKREYMRRFNERRARAGGRPQVRKPCPKCGRKFGVARMRKHTPSCTGTLRPTLTFREASAAAHRLMDIVRANRQWNITVAEACLDPGWVLYGASDSDFHPCTIRNFTHAYRALARRKGEE